MFSVNPEKKAKKPFLFFKDILSALFQMRLFLLVVVCQLVVGEPWKLSFRTELLRLQGTVPSRVIKSVQGLSDRRLKNGLG